MDTKSARINLVSLSEFPYIVNSDNVIYEMTTTKSLQLQHVQRNYIVYNYMILFPINGANATVTYP